MNEGWPDASWAGLAQAWLARAEAGCEALGPQWRLVRAVSATPLFVLAGRRQPPGAGLEVALPVIEPEGASTPFALLCGPAAVGGPDTAGIDLAESLIEQLGAMRQAEREERVAALTPHDGEADATTGFGGPATWARLLAAEDEHCRVLGHCATVMLAEVDRPGRGSEPEVARRWVQRGAAALRRSLRDQDALCLIRPGHYRILAVECPAAHADAVADRLTGALLDVGIGASIAAAPLLPAEPADATDASATGATDPPAADASAAGATDPPAAPAATDATGVDRPSPLGAALAAAEQRLVAVQAGRKTVRL